MAADNQNNTHAAEAHRSDNSKGQHQQEHHEERSSPRGGGVLGALLGLIGGFYHAVMRGGELQAMGRTGIDELGQALKAFPDSIQARAEPGGMFEPLHSDIAAARDQHAPRESLASPGDIAKGRNFTAAEPEEGTVHGKGNVQTAQNDTPVIGPWTQRILEERERTENGGTDQNEQGRGRSLPDEQQDRGRGR
jgi:hypothetical protein